MHDHHGGGGRLRYLAATMALNLLIFLAELIGGLMAGSLALVADAFHNLTDLTALIFVLVARRLQRIPPSDNHTFGFRRADVFAGLLNGGILFLAMGGVVSHAVERLVHPHPVDGRLMLLIGALGLVANTLGVCLLYRDPTRDLGLRSAVLHLATDAASSAAVVLGGWLIVSFGWDRVDPVLSILIAVVAIAGAVRVIAEGVHIMMEGTPRGLDAEAVREAMLRVPGVRGVEHVHLWSLASTEPALTATVRLDECSLRDAQQILRSVEHTVGEDFGIHHTVFQVEPCGTRSAPCSRR